MANLVILKGNLGKDPELRETQTGKKVVNFSLATSEGFGEKKTTEWHNIVAWDKTAEVCAQYLKKGDHVYLEGRIATRSWDDKEGTKRYTTEIIAHKVELPPKSSTDVAPEVNSEF